MNYEQCAKINLRALEKIKRIRSDCSINKKARLKQYFNSLIRFCLEFFFQINAVDYTQFSALDARFDAFFAFKVMAHGFGTGEVAFEERKIKCKVRNITYII